MLFAAPGPNQTSCESPRGLTTSFLPSPRFLPNSWPLALTLHAVDFLPPCSL